MKRFILSDLHIGHPQAQYDVMDQAIEYISQNAGPGDEIWGLGDWFHMTEEGFSFCINHAMAQKFRDLASRIPTKYVPGNHDFELEAYRDEPGSPNPIEPITLIEPFAEDGIWYCHGHDHDPICEYLPHWWHRLWAQFIRKVMKQNTPGVLKGESITQTYLAAVNLAHSRMLLALREKAATEHQDYKGVVLGHTHLPLRQDCPELPFLLNSGDMRDSSTFLVKDGTTFHIMRWHPSLNQWQSVLSLTP
jgi:UDP-2,3-diacylglucosamine pyrophosphatase LpxH